MTDDEDLHSFLRHDLKNKLQIALGYLQLLDRMDLSDDQMEYVEKGKKALHQSTRLIEKVRNLRSVGEEEKRTIGLDKKIEKVIEEHRAKTKEKGITIDYEATDIKVSVDSLVDDMFSSLLLNSIQHSDCDRILIDVEDKGGNCLIIFEDDGEGIPERLKDEIYEVGSKSEDSPGFGLGLSLVKRIVDSYGGTIEHSELEDGGTRFEIILEKA